MNIGNKVKLSRTTDLVIPKEASLESLHGLLGSTRMQIFLLEHGRGHEQGRDTHPMNQGIQLLYDFVKEIVQRIQTIQNTQKRISREMQRRDFMFQSFPSKE